MFSSLEFDYVFRYLEAEQIGAIVREQEKKATWKTEQLQHIRESEVKKSWRNLQVDKMKSEMLNLQIQLHGLNSTAVYDDVSPAKEGLRRRKNASLNRQDSGGFEKQDGDIHPDSQFSFNAYESPRGGMRAESPFAVDFEKQSMDAFLFEITELEEDAGDIVIDESTKADKAKSQSKYNLLASAVQFIGDGVFQVQSIGNQAVSNLVSFMNIVPKDSNSNEPSNVEYGLSNDRRGPNVKNKHLNRTASLQSNRSRTSDPASLQIERIVHHIWSRMILNNDIVCYCCFVLVFVWNFSLLSVVYLASLFLYALCVHTGQELYNCKDGEWFSAGFSNGRGRLLNSKQVVAGSSCWAKAKKVFQVMKQVTEMVILGCFRYWKSLTQEAESPPYFVQLSMDVKSWLEDGIQPERISSALNQILRLVHEDNCNKEKPNHCPYASKVQIQSTEKSTENVNVALAVFEVVFTSPLAECVPAEQFSTLTPAADVAKEILKAQFTHIVEEAGFPYSIISVIGGGKREIDLYAYIFGADLAFFFLVAIFYQSVIKNK